MTRVIKHQLKSTGQPFSRSNTQQHCLSFFYCPCSGSRQTLTASISWVVFPRAGQGFPSSPTRQPNSVVRQIVRFSSQTINRHRLETNEEEEKRKHRNEIKRLELESVRVRAGVHACVCEAATLFDLSLSPPPSHHLLQSLPIAMFRIMVHSHHLFLPLWPNGD